MDRVPHPETAAAVTPEPFTPAQMRALKIAIVVMSIILVLGFTAILARLFYLAKQPAQPSPVVASSRGPAAALMPDIDLALPQRAQVRSVSLTSTGDRMAVHFDAPAGPGIIVLDLASGKVASRVRLTTPP